MYNRSEIMKRAWGEYRRLKGLGQEITFGEALKSSWSYAKQRAEKMSRYIEKTCEDLRKKIGHDKSFAYKGEAYTLRSLWDAGVSRIQIREGFHGAFLDLDIGARKYGIPSKIAETIRECWPR